VSYLTIHFGNNHIIGANGILAYVNSQGKEKDFFTITFQGSKPVITTEIRNNLSKIIAKCYKSASFIAVDKEYQKY